MAKNSQPPWSRLGTSPGAERLYNLLAARQLSGLWYVSENLAITELSGLALETDKEFHCRLQTAAAAGKDEWMGDKYNHHISPGDATKMLLISTAKVTVRESVLWWTYKIDTVQDWEEIPIAEVLTELAAQTIHYYIFSLLRRRPPTLRAVSLVPAKAHSHF